MQALTEELKIILPQQLLPQFDKLYNDSKVYNFSTILWYTRLCMIEVPQCGQLTNPFHSQKNYATTKFLVSTHPLEESGKTLNDPRKNVQEFMKIEGKQ